MGISIKNTKVNEDCKYRSTYSVSSGRDMLADRDHQSVRVSCIMKKQFTTVRLQRSTIRKSPKSHHLPGRCTGGAALDLMPRASSN